MSPSWFKEGSHCHHETRNVARPQIKLCDSDECDAECAEGMAERRSLRNGSNVYQPERNSYDCPEHHYDGDPLVVHIGAITNGLNSNIGRAKTAARDLAGQSFFSPGFRSRAVCQGLLFPPAQSLAHVFGIEP